MVDDDKACRDLCSQILTQSGFAVSEAHNGHQAFFKAMDRCPALVVTDLGLPGLDGYELARKLRQHPSTERIPIVAITGRGDFIADTSRALAAGCDSVLAKPFLPERLIEEVEWLLARADASAPRNGTPAHSA
jgi:DNA-binding response OmpR family regulator